MAPGSFFVDEFSPIYGTVHDLEEEIPALALRRRDEYTEWAHVPTGSDFDPLSQLFVVGALCYAQPEVRVTAVTLTDWLNRQQYPMRFEKSFVGRIMSSLHDAFSTCFVGYLKHRYLPFEKYYYKPKNFHFYTLDDKPSQQYYQTPMSGRILLMGLRKVLIERSREMIAAERIGEPYKWGMLHKVLEIDPETFAWVEKKPEGFKWRKL